MTFYKNMQEKFFRQVVDCKQVVLITPKNIKKAPSNVLVGFFKENPKETLDLRIVDFKVIDQGPFAANYGKFKIEIAEFGIECFHNKEDQVGLSGGGITISSG